MLNCSYLNTDDFLIINQIVHTQSPSQSQAAHTLLSNIHPCNFLPFIYELKFPQIPLLDRNWKQFKRVNISNFSFTYSLKAENTEPNSQTQANRAKKINSYEEAS